MDGGGTFFRIKLNFMENQARKKKFKTGKRKKERWINSYKSNFWMLSSCLHLSMVIFLYKPRTDELGEVAILKSDNFFFFC